MNLDTVFNISYHCTSYEQVDKVMNHFGDMGYTFNLCKGYTTLGDKGNDGKINTIIHVSDEEKDMGYDYYYVDYPDKKEMISKNKNVVEASILFREEKLRRICK